MNTYYEVIGEMEGYREILYGSFLKTDCEYEIDAEKDSWKNDGYRNIKIVPRETDDSPDPEVYGE